MNTIKTILVPLAMKNHSRGIFNYAAGVALTYDADILVLNVINIRDVESIAGVASMGYNVDETHYLEEVKKERRELMDDIVEKNDFPSKRVKILFKVGHPADEILSTIVQEMPDLVIMGTQGRTSLRSTLVGDVAKQVFQRSPVPVLSFRCDDCRKKLLKRIQPE
jgi:nucleotide-binding universal stress UspA family protein